MAESTHVGPEMSPFRKFTPKLLLITFMVGRWVGSLGQVMLDFRILGHIMLDFLGDDRTCSSENKKLAVAKLCFMWPDYG
jgi:hypothetical protein